MNIIISKLDNFIIEKGEYHLGAKEILSQNIENLPDIYGSLLFPCNEIEAAVYFENRRNIINLNIYTFLEQLKFREDFGNVAYRNLKCTPIICCLVPSNDAEISIRTDPQILRICDVIYRNINYDFQAMSVAFSIACWMVKDCCVTSTEFYQFNCFNAYRVRNKIENIYTFSNGTIGSTEFDIEALNKAINLTPKIYGYMLQKRKTDENIYHESDELYSGAAEGGKGMYNIEGLLNPENTSFCRALVFLQQARKSGYLVAKIEKYCSTLECLFAIRKMHKVNLKNITAAYIGDEINESIIRNDIHEAFGIRSDFSHGDYIKYLSRHSKTELMELSQRIDQYVRKVFIKLFEEPDKNYNLETRNIVENYFSKIAREKYPGDYENETRKYI